MVMNWLLAALLLVVPARAQEGDESSPPAESKASGEAAPDGQAGQPAAAEESPAAEEGSASGEGADAKASASEGGDTYTAEELAAPSPDAEGGKENATEPVNKFQASPEVKPAKGKEIQPVPRPVKKGRRASQAAKARPAKGAAAAPKVPPKAVAAAPVVAAAVPVGRTLPGKPAAVSAVPLTPFAPFNP